jgi:hypothetical protein
MLAQDYKFHFVNRLGVDMDLSSNSANEKIDLDLQTYELGADGALSYNSEVNLAYSAADVSYNGSAECTGQDNSATLAYGLHGRLTVETDDPSADGTVDLYIEFTTDGGTTFPSDAADWDAEEDGIFVCSVKLVGDGAGYVRSTPFEI